MQRMATKRFPADHGNIAGEQVQDINSVD